MHFRIEYLAFITILICKCNLLGYFVEAYTNTTKNNEIRIGLTIWEHTFWHVARDYKIYTYSYIPSWGYTSCYNIKKWIDYDYHKKL